MGLPRYTGPFEVGVLDLELPFRQPRSFETPCVTNSLVNQPPPPKPTRTKAADERARLAREKAHQRQQRGQGADADDVPSATANEGRDGDSSPRDDDDDDDEDWDPIRSGCKTSTLHAATVLFSVFYPTSLNRSQLKRQHYRRAFWMARPKREAFLSMLRYLDQYGPFAYPASPALFFLLSARLQAHVGAPLASPSDERMHGSAAGKAATVNTTTTTAAAAESLGAGAQDETAPPPRFPLVIFSHGLAGNRLSYSQYLGELASHGCVVCAVEHRDGSGVGSQVRPPAPMGWQLPRSIDPRGGRRGRGRSEVDDGRSEKVESPSDPSSSSSSSSSPAPPVTLRDRLRGKRRHPTSHVPYLTFERFGLRSFAPQPDDDEMALRQAQLSMRGAELDECLHVMRRIHAGQGAEVARESTRHVGSKLGDDGRKPGRTSASSDHEAGTTTPGEGYDGSVAARPESLAAWRGKLDVDSPALVGHSFGGATVIEACRRRRRRRRPTRPQGAHGEGDEGGGTEASPWPYAVVLDPWVDPIRTDDGPDETARHDDGSAAARTSGRGEGEQPRRKRPPIEVPLYTINSEGFSIWREHFQKLRRIMARARLDNPESRGWLMTLCGCQHLDFSDYPFLLPHVFRSTVGPRATIQVFSRATLTQMRLARTRRRAAGGEAGGAVGGARDAEGQGAAFGAARPRSGEDGEAPAPMASDPKLDAVAKAETSDEANGDVTGSREKGEETRESVAQGHDAQSTAESKKHADGAEASSHAPADGTATTTSSTTTQTLAAVVPGLAATLEWWTSERDDAARRRRKELEERGVTVAHRDSQGDLVGERVLPEELDPQERLDLLAGRDEVHVPHGGGGGGGADGATPRGEASSSHTKSTSTSRNHAPTTATTPEADPNTDAAAAAPTSGVAPSVPTVVDPEPTGVDPDARVVHAELEEISDALSHKVPKVLSLLGLMMRLKGVSEGLARPGTVLVHRLDVVDGGPGGEHGQEAGNEADDGGANVNPAHLGSRNDLAGATATAGAAKGRRNVRPKRRKPAQAQSAEDGAATAQQMRDARRGSTTMTTTT